MLQGLIMVMRAGVYQIPFRGKWTMYALASFYAPCFPSAHRPRRCIASCCRGVFHVVARLDDFTTASQSASVHVTRRRWLCQLMLCDLLIRKRACMRYHRAPRTNVPIDEDSSPHAGTDSSGRAAD